MGDIGPWGWFGIAFLTFFAISTVWMVVAIHNAPDFDEYMSGEWDRKRRDRRR